MVKEFRNVETRQTEIGFGVFAIADFEAHEMIGEVRGEVIDALDYESDYCIELEGDTKLEPRKPFRLLNHSCAPNCELVLWKTRKQDGKKYPRVWLQALMPICRGTELSIDYAWPAECAIPCRCTSRHCRGWIVHPDELHVMTC